MSQAVNYNFALIPLIEGKTTKKYPSMRFYGTKEDAFRAKEAFLDVNGKDFNDLNKVLSFTCEIELVEIDNNYYSLPEYDNIYKFLRDEKQYIGDMNEQSK